MKTRAAVAAIFGAVLCAALLHRVPDVVDRPLYPATSGVPVPVPLLFASTDGRVSLRDITITVRDAGALERVDQIHLFFGTFETVPVMEYGWLQIAGSPCSFHASRQRLRENTKVVFRRTADCGGGAPHPAQATLRLALAGPARYARAAVWTVPRAAGDAPLLTTAAFERELAVAGRTIMERPLPPVRRIVLLSFMWELRVRHVVMLLACALALVGAGAVFISSARIPAAALAAGALTAGVALSYAIVVPPLQAPDEPDHLLSFAKLTARPALAHDTSAWARRIHFHRMTFTTNERFTPADREQPFDRDWPPQDVFAEDVRLRSSTTTRLWQALAPIVPGRPPHALLFFRSVHALALGAAFAGGTALVASAGTAAAPALLAAVVLTIPTLPFFGMQMSELTFTFAGFVLAGSAAILLLNGASGRVTGPIFGLAIALIAGGPRSGWPGVIIIGALAAGGLLSRAAPPRGPGDAAWFWGGLAAPGLALFGSRLLWIPAPFYEQWHLSTFDPRGGVSSASFLLILAIGATAGFLAERLLRRVPAVSRGASQVARVLCAIGAVWIAGTLIWSAWGTLPSLAVVERVPPASARDYVVSVLLPLVTAARVRGFDFLTWLTLWGGFGWADTILPSPAIAAATIVAALAAVLALIAAARQREGTRALIAIFGVAGLAASAAAAAVGSYGMHRNVHGRYLIGAAIIGLCLLPAPALLAHGKRIPVAVRSAALLALACGLHAFALVFLLEKYFG
jgi:hypothetical protein